MDRDIEIGYICAVEPNKCFHSELRQNLTTSGAKFAIDGRYFDEDYESDECFDLIIFQQSLYYIKNPVAALQKAKTFLKEGGKMMILLQGERACSRQWSLILKNNLEENSKLPHLLAAPELIEGLKCANMDHDVIEERGIIVDVDDFVSGKDSLFVTKATQVQFERLDSKLKDILHQHIRESSFVDEISGRYKCTTYIVLISIPKQ